MSAMSDFTPLPRPDYHQHPKMAKEASRVTDETRLAAIERFLPALRKAWADWLRHGPPRFDARLDGPGDIPLKALQTQGLALLKFDPGLKARLNDAVAPALADIRADLATVQGRPRFQDMNRELRRTEWPQAHQIVDAALERLEVFRIGGAYVGRPLRVKRLFVQINTAHEAQQRYGVIDQEGLPQRKTDYWHIDSDIFPAFKALLYLNPVGLNQGPFRYVPGTHRGVDPLELVIRKVNDSLKPSAVEFLSLPEAFRMHALFGPYMTGGEPETAQLLVDETVCIGDGDLIVFDNNGVHRGGFVREGERRLMQILFEPA